MSDLPSLERAVLSLKYIIEFREDRIGKLKRKPTLSEKEKIFMGEEEELLKAVRIVTEAVGRGLDIELGKLPPQAIDMEEAVIGAILAQSDPMRDKEGKEIAPPAIHKLAFLKPEHFYDPRHQLILKACRSILLAGKGTDLRSVVHELRKSGDIEAVGGASYMAELIGKVANSSAVEIHARVVVEMAAKRKLVEMAGYIMGEGHKDSKDAWNLFEMAEKEIKETKEWLEK